MFMSCRISQPHLLATCHKRLSKQGSCIIFVFLVILVQSFIESSILLWCLTVYFYVNLLLLIFSLLKVIFSCSVVSVLKTIFDEHY